MHFQEKSSDTDLFLAKQLEDFIPQEIFDIHTHAYHPEHFPENEWTFLKGIDVLGCKKHRDILQQYMPSRIIHGLYFGLPRKTADRDAMNKWVADEVIRNGTNLSRTLMVVSPEDNTEAVADALRSGRFCGIKVYHCYASRSDTMNAMLTEYAPEWMWELLQETNGVLMLHIVRDAAMDDPENRKQVRELCRKYPRVRLILAHVGRSFNYRNARNGLALIADIDNLTIDTSAICETESFKAAIKAFGTKRILWGSDFPVSEMRGRCITTGNHFFWLHPELIDKQYLAPASDEMTLIGIESLLALKESCTDIGLNKSDIADIFLNNALNVLRPHLPTSNHQEEIKAKDLWLRSRQVISGGTGLLSKRAEQFHEEWPSFFSRSAGCEVWDINGKRYVDCAGGIGAVLLGYADKDVTESVIRRLTLGSYASLVNPQEIELAEKLLQLHPWAGKIRYARTGGEAMTVAVRIARAASGKSGIAFCGYHGWHDWYLAANLGKTNALDGHLLPGLQPKGVPRELTGTSVPFQYNNWASFENAIEQLGNNIAAVVMEPMRSQFPENNFIHRVKEKCREKGAVLVIDEITSGLRYGYPGALARIGVEPDMAVYAKALGNGLPFAAIVGREDIMHAADDSFISSSYWTDGVGTAAALAVLEKMEREQVSESVWQKGSKLRDTLQNISDKYLHCSLQIGGMPSSPTFTFTSPLYGVAIKRLFTAGMQKAGFLVSGIFYLMHAHQEQHLSLFVEAFEETLSVITKSVLAGELDNNNPHSFQHGFTRLA